MAFLALLVMVLVGLDKNILLYRQVSRRGTNDTLRFKRRQVPLAQAIVRSSDNSELAMDMN